MLCVYDLAIYPTTFDFVIFLENADRYRCAKGAEVMDVLVMSQRNDPIQDDFGAGHPVELDPDTFVKNFIFDAIQLYGSVGDITVARNRRRLCDKWAEVVDQRPVFPEKYTPSTPDAGLKSSDPPIYGIAHRNSAVLSAPDGFHLRAPKEQLRQAKLWLRRFGHGKIPITLTLREAAHDPLRNSDVTAWQKAVEQIDQDRFMVVVMRDYMKLYESPVIIGRSVVECPEAVISIPFRAALYELAYLNLHTNGGPASLCFLDPVCRYVVFASKGDLETVYSKMAFQHNLPVGLDLPGATPAKRLVWAADSCDEIILRFNEAIEYLDAIG